MGAACRAVLERNVRRRGCVLATYRRKDDSRSRLKYPVLRSARRHVGRGATPFIRGSAPFVLRPGCAPCPGGAAGGAAPGRTHQRRGPLGFPLTWAVEFKLNADGSGERSIQAPRHAASLQACVFWIVCRYLSASISDLRPQLGSALRVVSRSIIFVVSPNSVSDVAESVVERNTGACQRRLLLRPPPHCHRFDM